MEKMEVEMDDVQNSKDSIQTQLEESLNRLKPLEDGQLVDGSVIAVTDEYVFIDIGYKSEGKIPVSEYEILSIMEDLEDLMITKLERIRRNRSGS